MMPQWHRNCPQCDQLWGEQKKCRLKRIKQFFKCLLLFSFGLGPTLNENEMVGALTLSLLAFLPHFCKWSRSASEARASPSVPNVSVWQYILELADVFCLFNKNPRDSWDKATHDDGQQRVPRLQVQPHKNQRSENLSWDTIELLGYKKKTYIAAFTAGGLIN
jgi:hypothetical protein